MAPWNTPITNLPVERGVFVGRDEQLEALRTFFHDDLDTAVTLVGPDGIGKTRLALRFAAEELPIYGRAGGIFVCDLSEVVEPLHVLHHIARSLRLDLLPNTAEDAVQILTQALQGREPTLLILDGIDGPESVRSIAAQVIQECRRSSAHIHFISTTRQVLGFSEEKMLAIPALSLPPLAINDDQAFRYAGPALFLERIREQNRHYQPTPADLRAIVEMARLLSGVPGAIELAAARTRALAPAELVERLPRRPDRRHVGRREALAGALSWSWDLLSSWEKMALAQATVFRGGFDIEAAQAILDLSDDPTSPDIVTALHSLCDKWLLREDVNPDRPDSPRHTLPTVVREFAESYLNHLANSSTKPALDIRHKTMQRHANYFVKSGLLWADGCDKRGGLSLRRKLEQESENLQAILKRTFAQSPSYQSALWALKATLSLEPIATVRGPSDQYLNILDKTIILADQISQDFFNTPTGSTSQRDMFDDLRARTYECRGRARRARGQMQGSLADLEKALSLAQNVDNPLSVARAWANIGTHHVLSGSFDAARLCYDRSLAIVRNARDVQMEGRSLGFYGQLLTQEKDLDGAIRCFEDALRLYRKTGDRRYEGIHTGQLGQVYEKKGDLDEALQCYQRALAIHREQGNRRHEGITLSWLGNLQLEQGNNDESRLYLQQALALQRDVLDDRMFVAVHTGLGDLAFAQGQRSQSLDHWELALREARRQKWTQQEIVLLARLALPPLVEGSSTAAGKHAWQYIDGAASLLRNLPAAETQSLRSAIDLYRCCIAWLAPMQATQEDTEPVTRHLLTQRIQEGYQHPAADVRAAARNIVALQLLREKSRRDAATIGPKKSR